MKRVMLYFGSFNPIHKGHIAMAEYVVEAGLCDELVLMVSPQSPHKTSLELAPEMDRFEMAEMACAGSKYPDKIKASVVEFLLPKPSYTIDTLEYLRENYGSQMQLSLLLGGDQIQRFDSWKSYQQILDNYTIYIYPRREAPLDRFLDRVTVLHDAPLQDLSSTLVRRALGMGGDTSMMLNPEVAKYIAEKRLWNPESRMESLNLLIEQSEQSCEQTNGQLYLERGMLHYQRTAWGEALNDLNRCLSLEPQCIEAQQYANMAQEILEFRYKDIYNP